MSVRQIKSGDEFTEDEIEKGLAVLVGIKASPVPAREPDEPWDRVGDDG